MRQGGAHGYWPVFPWFDTKLQGTRACCPVVPELCRLHIKATCIILKNYWDALPPSEVAELLTVLMNKCAHDKKAPLVRAAVADGFGFKLCHITAHTCFWWSSARVTDQSVWRSPQSACCVLLPRLDLGQRLVAPNYGRSAPSSCRVAQRQVTHGEGCFCPPAEQIEPLQGHFRASGREQRGCGCVEGRFHDGAQVLGRLGVHVHPACTACRRAHVLGVSLAAKTCTSLLAWAPRHCFFVSPASTQKDRRSVYSEGCNPTPRRGQLQRRVRRRSLLLGTSPISWRPLFSNTIFPSRLHGANIL